jgi:hypothetical protein
MRHAQEARGMTAATKQDLVRILRHTDPQPGECWRWSAYVDKDGYGRTQLAGRSLGAHRAVYTLMVGPIPKGHDLHHRCEVPGCVNPEHLQPLTRADHNRLRWAGVTHCVHGHEYDERNTYWRPTGQRDCRACTATRQRAYQARKRKKQAS